jgi:hypothetical protein
LQFFPQDLKWSAESTERDRNLVPLFGMREYYLPFWTDNDFLEQDERWIARLPTSNQVRCYILK